VATKLTGKQRKLVQGIAQGKSQRQAAKAAGMDSTYASKVLKKPQVSATLQELMEKSGLGNSVLLSKHRELLNASRTVSAISGKDANAGTVDFIEVPDSPVQVKALDLAYKLRGAYIDKLEISGEIRYHRVVSNVNAPNE
jgi:hypothetical protein